MINFPTSIEMHKKINLKEFALSSFAEILKKNQRQNTKRPSLTRKLSKQMTLIEYDNMERAPSCKTPRETKSIIFKKKPQATLIKEKYIQGQKLKLFHFMNDSKSRKIQLTSYSLENQQNLEVKELNYKLVWRNNSVLREVLHQVIGPPLILDLIKSKMNQFQNQQNLSIKVDLTIFLKSTLSAFGY